MHLSPLEIKARVGGVHHMAVDKMRRIARIVHLAATPRSCRTCDTVKVSLILIKYGLKYRHRGCHSGNVLLTRWLRERIFFSFQEDLVNPLNQAVPVLIHVRAMRVPRLASVVSRKRLDVEGSRARLNGGQIC